MCVVFWQRFIVSHSVLTHHQGWLFLFFGLSFTVLTPYSLTSGIIQWLNTLMSSGVHLLQGKPITQSGAFYVVVVVQSFSHVQLFATPLTAPRQASLSFTISCSLIKFMSIESVMPFNHLILLLSPSPPTFNLSHIKVYSNK